MVTSSMSLQSGWISNPKQATLRLNFYGVIILRAAGCEIVLPAVVANDGQAQS